MGIDFCQAGFNITLRRPAAPSIAIAYYSQPPPPPRQRKGLKVTDLLVDREHC